MWIRNATNVTNDSIRAESGSSRNARSTERFPTAIQLATGSTTVAWVPAANGISREYATSVARPAAPTPTADTNDLPRRVPRRALTTIPASGIAGISQSGRVVMLAYASPLQQVDLVHVDRLGMPEQRDEDREADRGLRRGDRDHEEDDDLPLLSP